MENVNRDSHLMGEKERRLRSRASAISLVVGILLMAVKFWGYGRTGSQAVLSDALESIVNVVAAALALFVVYYSAKPVDRDHPYGHGKVEYFSAAFEGGLITFAAVMIMVEAVRALLSGHSLQHIDVGIYVVLGAGLANLVLGLFLIRVGKTSQSVALKASGYHVVSDFWTSAGVGGGLVIVYLTQIYWLDSVIAIVVGALLARTGVQLVRSSIGGLMDEEDIEVLKTLATVFKKCVDEGIIQIHHVKVIRAGWYHHIDAHVVLPEFWTVKDVHERVVKFEREVIATYPYQGEMNFHPDPCRQAYCRVCDLEACPIRKEKFEKRMPVKLEHLRSPLEPEGYRPPHERTT